MTPSTLKAMMYLLPAMSFIFTFWLPATVQLSFFVSGVLSYLQATLFKQPWFRNWANMSPLPTPGGPAANPPSPYKGTLKISANAALSQNELNSRFQGAAVKSASTQVEKAKSPLRKLKAPDFIKDALGTKDEMIERANAYMDRKRATSEVADRKAFEKKRQEQLKKERWELENRRRAERAAKRDLMKK
jgi:YidC/Oxa1 family membrane protein insertase